jgi:hypothetical protein
MHGWKGPVTGPNYEPNPRLAAEAMRETLLLSGFVVKDSGERAQFESGMQRDTTTGKIRYDLVFDGPMFERVAAHLTKGAVKYEPRNWMKANSMEEADRYRESAVRHFILWLNGVTDEDHAAAVFFNINGYEYVKERVSASLSDRKPEKPEGPAVRQPPPCPRA